MKQILLVGLGGFLGVIGRYSLGGLVLHPTVEWRFPVSTFLINVLGCFILGVISGLAEKHDLFTPEMRILLMPGILGGFTTFSAFAYESVFLIRRGEMFVALSYALLSVVFGLLAVWIGVKIIGE